MNNLRIKVCHRLTSTKSDPQQDNIKPVGKSDFFLQKPVERRAKTPFPHREKPAVLFLCCSFSEAYLPNRCCFHLTRWSSHLNYTRWPPVDPTPVRSARSARLAKWICGITWLSWFLLTQLLCKVIKCARFLTTVRLDQVIQTLKAIREP